MYLLLPVRIKRILSFVMMLFVLCVIVENNYDNVLLILMMSSLGARYLEQSAIQVRYRISDYCRKRNELNLTVILVV